MRWVHDLTKYGGLQDLSGHISLFIIKINYNQTSYKQSFNAYLYTITKLKVNLSANNLLQQRADEVSE